LAEKGRKKNARKKGKRRIRAERSRHSLRRRRGRQQEREEPDILQKEKGIGEGVTPTSASKGKETRARPEREEGMFLVNGGNFCRVKD